MPSNTLNNPPLSQIRTRVRMFIDEPQQANYTDANINAAINIAQQQVATEISLVDEKYFVATTPTTIASVAQQRFYPLATDFWKMTRLEDSNTGLRLEFTDFASQNNFFADAVPPLVAPNQIGYGMSIVGNSLAITPTPTVSGINCQYWYVPVLPDMVADSDVSAIPIMFIDLLAIQAAIDMLISDEDDTTSLERKYGVRFNQLVRATRDRQQQSPKHVTRVEPSGDNYRM
jgi:hypothetical protein